jgi:CheY-like chemotaxis protein
VAFTQYTTRSQVIVPNGLAQVLILDDERFDRHRLERFCSSLDFACQVKTATTISAFQDMINGTMFNLILIDYYLPDGTGLDAIRMVNACENNHNAATLMITGTAETDIKQEALASGCHDCLNKDDLSATTFSLAVHNAMVRKMPITTLPAKTYPHADVESITEHFAAKCAQDMKPMVSRMMRHVRDLRARSGDDITAASPPVGAIEDSCVNIWEFLVALERSSGDAIIAETFMGETGTMQNAEPKVSRKPPSPFSKFRN